jgi:hypothetical protein
MNFRRNIFIQKRQYKQSQEYMYERIFLRMYYGGLLNDSFLRLLACLDFPLAMDLLYEKEGGVVRFSDQFPLINFAELDQIIPNFSYNFTIRTIKKTYFLLKKTIFESQIPVDIEAHQTLQNIGMYLEEYEFYPDACNRIIEQLNGAIEYLETNMSFDSAVTALFSRLPIPIAGRRQRQTRAPDIIKFLYSTLDYLNKICGECIHCKTYHGSEDADFSQPVEVFRRNVIYEAFQLARKFKRGRRLKQRLIPYVFNALEKRPIHRQLERAPIQKRYERRLEQERMIFPERNPCKCSCHS